MVMQTEPAEGLFPVSVCFYHGFHKARVVSRPVITFGGWAIHQTVVISCSPSCGARIRWVEVDEPLVADCHCFD